MSQTPVNNNLSRRGFLQTAVAAAAGAAAAGASAAFVLNNAGESAAIMPAAAPVAPLTRAQTTMPVAQESADLFSQLVAAQADNMRLQAELAAAQRKIESLQTATGQGDMVQAMQQELNTAHNELGVLSGLVALYDQLDGLDVETLIDNGLNAVGETLGGLLDHLPTLSEGLDAGERALAELEAQVPLVDSGRRWLANQMNKLGGYLDGLEQVLRQVVARAGTFFDMLDDWFKDILKWLPFGIGSTAILVIDALTALLNETPHTINGLRANVADPLDLWLAEEAGQQRIHSRLITPLRQQTMDPIPTAITRARETHATYEEQLATPVQQAIAGRRLVRQLIADYRQEHQI